MTTEATPKPAPAFDPPGPGSWAIDGSHFPRRPTKYAAEIFRTPFEAGFNHFTSRYGLFVDHIRYEFVNGFVYFQPVPVAGEEAPARVGAAIEAVRTRRWRSDVDRWEAEVKPRSIETQLSLQAIDPDELSTEELLDHLDRLGENLIEKIECHHQFNGAAMILIGMLIVKAAGWGISVPEALALVRGAAPESAGVAAGFEDLLEALRADTDSAALLASGRPAAEVLEELRSRSGAVGRAAQAWLDLVSYRLAGGLDLAEACAIEQPGVLVDLLSKTLARGGAADDRRAVPGEVAALRDRVPEDQRAGFDEALEDVMLTYRLRDERGLYNDVWAWGLLRRSVLSAGRRLAEAGRVFDPEHLTHASHGEIRALLLGEDVAPAPGDLAQRARRRAADSAVDCPSWIGEPPQGPPPLDGLPPEAALVNAAIGAAIGALFEETDAVHEERVIKGIPAAPGVYEGTARLLSGSEEIGRLEQGDVLVVPSTTEAFNLALPTIGAIVTNHGGLLSHAAIVSREYGIPSVVGTREATRLISDGSRVRVDGGTGEVTLLG